MEHSSQYSAFVTCSSGLQYLLEKELKALGAEMTKPIPSGVHCSGSLEFLYKACLWSRVGNRVLLLVSEGKVDSAEQVYEAAYAVAWSELFSVDSEFAVVFSGSSEFVRNTTFGALKIKDAVVYGYSKKEKKFFIYALISNKKESSYRLRKVDEYPFEKNQHNTGFNRYLTLGPQKKLKSSVRDTIQLESAGKGVNNATAFYYSKKQDKILAYQGNLD